MNISSRLYGFQGIGYAAIFFAIIVASADGSTEPNLRKGDFGSKQIMKKNGWNLSCSGEQLDKETDCKRDWQCFEEQEREGNITTTLDGHGRATLRLRNCHTMDTEGNTVLVLLDGEEIASLQGGIEKTVGISYKQGAKLKIMEEYGVIELISFEFAFQIASFDLVLNVKVPSNVQTTDLNDPSQSFIQTAKKTIQKTFNVSYDSISVTITDVTDTPALRRLLSSLRQRKLLISYTIRVYNDAQKQQMASFGENSKDMLSTYVGNMQSEFDDIPSWQVHDAQLVEKPKFGEWKVPNPDGTLKDWTPDVEPRVGESDAFPWNFVLIALAVLTMVIVSILLICQTRAKWRDGKVNNKLRRAQTVTASRLLLPSGESLGRAPLAKSKAGRFENGAGCRAVSKRQVRRKYENRRPSIGKIPSPKVSAGKCGRSVNSIGSFLKYGQDHAQSDSSSIYACQSEPRRSGHDSLEQMSSDSIYYYSQDEHPPNRLGCRRATNVLQSSYSSDGSIYSIISTSSITPNASVQRD